MDFRPTDEQLQIRDTLRRLLDRRLAALVEALPDRVPDDPAADLADAVAVGLPALGLPEHLGGAGTFADLVLAHEELGRGLAPDLFVALGITGRTLVHSSGERRDERLRALAAGEWSADLTENEPVGVEDLAQLQAELVVLAAARQVGGGRAVAERTIEHVRTREQFDRPIGTFQAVQHQLADVVTDLDASALAVAAAAWAVTSEQPASEVRRLAAIGGLAAAAAFRRATLVAHQLHGGMGFVLDSPLHLWSARALDDPTVPLARRELLDELTLATGITADGVSAPLHHRSR